MRFLLACLKPDAVLMLFVALAALLAYGYPGYRARASDGIVWLLWLLTGILAIVAWAMLVFV